MKYDIKVMKVCGILLLAIIGLSSCSSVGTVAAGAAVPAAFAGDTALLPLQYLGNCSDTLIRRGYEVGNYMNQYGDGTLEFVHRPNSMDLFYYVPGCS